MFTLPVTAIHKNLLFDNFEQMASSNVCEMFLNSGNETSFSSCDLEPDNILNPFYFMLYGVIMNLVIISGLVGNAISFAVFTKTSSLGCVRWYLAGLAIWDSALLVTSFFEWSLWSFWYQSAPPIIGPHVYVIYMSYGLCNVALTGCVWVILTLTIERYVATLHPLYHVRFNAEHRAKALVCLVSLSACVYNIPRFFEVQISYNRVFCCTTNITLISVPLIEQTDLVRNRIYFWLACIIGASLFLYFVPSLILLVLTVRMCKAIKRATRARGQMMILVSCAQQLLKNSATVKITRTKRLPKVGSETLLNENATRMMIIVLIKFLFCYALPNIVDLLEIVGSEALLQGNLLEVLTVLSNGFVTLNSSLNFLIYLLIGQRFRRDAMKLLKIRSNPASGDSEEIPLCRYPQVRYSQLIQLSDMMSGGRKLRLSKAPRSSECSSQ